MSKKDREKLQDTYNPKDFESKLYKEWEENRLFQTKHG